MHLRILILYASHHFRDHFGLYELVVHFTQNIVSLIKGEFFKLRGAIKAFHIQWDYSLG